MLNLLLRGLRYHPSTRWLFRDISGRKSKKIKSNSTIRNIASKQPEKVKDVTLSGTLSPGANFDLSVDGYDFRRDSGTWVFGDIAIGKQATVVAAKRADGTLYAKKINIVNG